MDWDAKEHYKEHQVAAGYDAARFSSIPGRVFNGWEKRVIAKCFASVPKGKVLVDMPCGTGRLAEPLLDIGYRVHGMDISAEMLGVAQQRLARFGDRFTHEVADAQQVQATAVRYDGALCARVLMHFPLQEQISFLAGVARLSGGVVVINHSFDSPYQRFRRRIKRMLGHRPSARWPVNNGEIRQLLQGAGLREVERFRLFPLISEAIYIVAEKL